VRPTTIICLLALTLVQATAVTDPASAEAKQKAGAVEEKERTAPSEIQVIRRFSVEKSLPLDSGVLAQSKEINRTKAAATSPRAVTIRPVSGRG